jgi:hypothetical protein
MALNDFLKEQGYKLELSDNEVVLERRRKINVVSIVVGVISISILMLVGSWLPVTSLMTVLSVVILFLVLRFNFRGTRPITIFDWTFKTMIKKSVWFFANSKSIAINGYKGIDLRTVDLSSQSSEGVDEFQKTIYLNTEDGEVVVIDFYIEEDETVDAELRELMQIIHNHLIKGV